MDELHKMKLAEGRQRALSERMRREDALAAEYFEWLKLEREAAHKLHLAYELGEGIAEARSEHVVACSLMPKLAPDSAFKRYRGESELSSALPDIEMDDIEVRDAA